MMMLSIGGRTSRWVSGQYKKYDFIEAHFFMVPPGVLVLHRGKVPRTSHFIQEAHVRVLLIVAGGCTQRPLRGPGFQAGVFRY